MRKLSMLLILCLLATMLPIGAFAEAYEDDIFEELPAEAVGETGAEGLTAEPEFDESEYREPEGDAYFEDDDLTLFDGDELDDADFTCEVMDDEAAVEALSGEETEEGAQPEEEPPAAEPHTDPKGPQLSANTLRLGVGETFELKGRMPGGKAGAIAYASSDEAVATVDDSGLVRAVAVGDAIITATAEDGTYAECFAFVRRAPEKVSFSSRKLYIGKGERTDALSVVLESESGECAGGYKLTSSKKKIVSVQEDGSLRGLRTGKSVITAKTYNGLKAKCTVRVYKAPKKVTIKVDKTKLGLGETAQASFKLPKKRAGHATYSSDNPEVVSVDAVTGEMKATGLGSTKIRVKTFNGKTDAVSVSVEKAPALVTFAASQYVMGVGMKTDSAASVDEGAAGSIEYTVADPSVASCKDGVVKALKAGETELTATTYNGRTASCKLVVKRKPAYVRLPYSTLNLYVGDVVQLTPDVGDSASTFKYTSNAKKRVSVTQDGVVTALKKGKATITIKTYNNKKFRLRVVVTKKSKLPGNPDSELPVDLSSVTLKIPARTTDISGIDANLAMIDAIRASAIGRIDAMRAADIISAADASKRKSIVNNAFADYAFPWMTPSKQVYWNKANSEGGVKDFKPDRVYYGLPYISGAGANRLYNAARALREARYTNSGKGYYMLNRKNLRNGKYCGNDCSGFVDACIWGTGKAHSSDRTTEIYYSDVYKTIKDYGCLRTGDLICKSNAHVVMFLYFASEDKSKMMIIENGGIEPGTNTVHCMIMDTGYYQSRGYKVRRLATLG